MKWKTVYTSCLKHDYNIHTYIQAGGRAGGRLCALMIKGRCLVRYVLSSKSVQAPEFSVVTDHLKAEREIWNRKY